MIAEGWQVDIRLANNLQQILFTIDRHRATIQGKGILLCHH
jgi:hypothetical protein